MSRGSREREDTTWLYLAVPMGRRRRRKLLAAGVPADQIPEKSVMVVLDHNCRKAKRKHADVYGATRHRRSRFATVTGELFTKEMVPA